MSSLQLQKKLDVIIVPKKILDKSKWSIRLSLYSSIWKQRRAVPGLQKDAALHMQREKQVSDRVTKKNLYHYNKNLFSGLDITCENVRLSQLETVIKILKHIDHVHN